MSCRLKALVTKNDSVQNMRGLQATYTLEYLLKVKKCVEVEKIKNKIFMVAGRMDIYLIIVSNFTLEYLL